MDLNQFPVPPSRKPKMKVSSSAKPLAWKRESKEEGRVSGIGGQGFGRGQAYSHALALRGGRRMDLNQFPVPPSRKRRMKVFSSAKPLAWTGEEEHEKALLQKLYHFPVNPSRKWKVRGRSPLKHQITVWRGPFLA